MLVPIADIVFWVGSALLAWTLLRPRITGLKVCDYSMVEFIDRSQKIIWSMWLMGLSLVAEFLITFATS